MTAALEGGEWSAARPGRTLPLGKTRYPLRIFIYCRQILKKKVRSTFLVHMIFIFLFFLQVYIQPDHGTAGPKHVYLHTVYSVTINV